MNSTDSQEPCGQSNPLQVSVGPKLFSFRSFQDWVNHAQRIWKFHGVDGRHTVCIDQRGRICGWGAHFMTARDEGAFPVDVYLLREDMAKRLDAPSSGGGL